MSDHHCGLNPFGNQIVIAPEVEETSAGGLLIPPSAENGKSKRGQVVAVGPGNSSKEGDITPIKVTVGTKVMVRGYAGTEYEHQGKTYIVIREDDLIGEIVSS